VSSPRTRNVPPNVCCSDMAYYLSLPCPDHFDPFDCADSMVYWSPQSGNYGLIIHDGGNSTISISHCPWCGVKLLNKSGAAPEGGSDVQP